MSTMLKAFFGATVGKIVATIVLAVCAALGFGPEVWVSWMLSEGSGSILLIARLVFLSLGASVLALWVWTFRRQQPEQAPRGELLASQREPYDLTQWVGHERYRVWIAACLWADTKPNPKVTPNTVAYAPLQKIKAALAEGRIAVAKGDGGMKSEIAKDQLYRLAEYLDERPKFLYPNG